MEPYESKIAPGIPRTGNPVFDRMTQVFLFLGHLASPRPPTPAEPESMSDADLRHGCCSLACGLVNDLGPIVQASFSGSAVDDPKWHHPWPTTVEMTIRQLFMMSLDAFGTASIVMEQNASAACLGNIRTAAECHVYIRWVLDGREAAEQRSRAIALTSAALKYALSSVGHWERNAVGQDASSIAHHFKNVIIETKTDLADLAKQRELTIPNIPAATALFDSYLPGAYFMFALLSNIGSHALPSPSFYGDPGTGSLIWDFKGLNVERSYFITQACEIQLATCKLTAPVCGWSGYEDLLARVEERLNLLAEEASKRLRARRDPTGRW